MDMADVLEVSRGAIWEIVIISAPVMLIGLGVGLIISLIQALTQIQEMTLAFVPKILVIFLSLLVFMPFMMTSLIEFTQLLADRIVGLGMS
jgi:flagellar biosynthetic protein FliQ